MKKYYKCIECGTLYNLTINEIRKMKYLCNACSGSEYSVLKKSNKIGNPTIKDKFIIQIRHRVHRLKFISFMLKLIKGKMVPGNAITCKIMICEFLKRYFDFQIAYNKRIYDFDIDGLLEELFVEWVRV